MKVVTGATGHIGGVLAAALAERDGEQCIRALLHRKREMATDVGIECVQGSILDKPSLISAFAGADVVFHTAAMVSIDRSLAARIRTINVQGTRNVVEAALECGVQRLVHFSSIHAFHHFPLDEPLDESRGPVAGPHASPYELSKVAGEGEVRRGLAKGLEAVILNPTSVVGPFDARPSHMGQFFLDLYYRRLPALVAGGYDWVDVRDVVVAALAAETRGRSGRKYILAGRWRSMREISELAQQTTGVPAPRVTLPIAVARALAPFQGAWDRLNGRRPLYTTDSLNAVGDGNRRISCAKAQAELGFRSRPLSDTVRDVYGWFEEHGYLGRGARND